MRKIPAPAGLPLRQSQSLFKRLPFFVRLHGREWPDGAGTLRARAGQVLAEVSERGLIELISLPSPRIIIALGAMIPLFVTAVAAASVVVDTETLVERLMLAYAAFMVAFLGALWALWVDEPLAESGRHLSPDGIAIAERKRLLLGMVPALISVLALLSSLSAGTMLLILDFIALLGLETAASHYGMPLAHHQRLRWGMTIAAVVMLIDVMCVRIYGLRIFF